MPALSCDPAALVAAAACFDCIPKSMEMPVSLYLLAVKAGLATDKIGVAAIVAGAKCFSCIPKSEYSDVELYLLCKLAGG